MSLLTRVITSVAVLTVAAIPVAALTIQNNSSKEISFAVDTGSVEAVYKVPAGGKAEVKEDCTTECAITGPWGFSRLVPQDANISTDGVSLVTAAATPAPSLVPENPAVDPAEAAELPAATTEAAPAPPRKRYATRKAGAQAKKGGTESGSWQMLFSGPGK